MFKNQTDKEIIESLLLATIISALPYCLINFILIELIDLPLGTSSAVSGSLTGGIGFIFGLGFWKRRSKIKTPRTDITPELNMYYYP